MVPLAAVGRVAELAFIGAFLRRAADRGAALVLSGDPGVGKTLLLDIAAEMAAASGAVVLRGQGVQFEANIGYGALNQLLLPLMPYVTQLDDAHRSALRIALGFDQGSRPERLLLSTAVAELLRYASRAAPLLIEVDDLPWLDYPSADILVFVARRVAGTRIGFLAASRPGDGSALSQFGLPAYELAPLSDDSSEELLVSRFPALAMDVRARVLAEAQGNPLALLELPAALSGPQRTGAVVLPATLPLTGRLQGVFSARIAKLPPAVRGFLLLAALDGSGDSRIVAGGSESRSGVAALAAATDADLLHLDPVQHRLVFRHPLIRSSVVELATDDERHAAHRKLAALFGDTPERHFWHLAAAAHEPDERVATQLDLAAEQFLQKGDAASAVAARVRAVELSPAPADRARRLAHAAYTSVGVTGERERAAGLLASALRHNEGIRDSLEATVATAYLLISREGDVDTAHQLLVSAIENATEPRSDGPLEVALFALMLVCFFAGRAELWQPFHQAIARLGPNAGDTLLVCNETFADPASTTQQTLERLSAAIRGLDRETAPVRINRVAFGATFVDRLSGCRAALRRVASEGRAAGAVVSAILALNMLGADDLQTGLWDLASERAAESVRLCDQHGYALLAWSARYVEAAIAAARGNHVLVRAVTDGMLSWATPRLLGALQWYAWQARSQAAIARGDYEETYRCLTQMTQPGELPSHLPHALHVGLDLVEACVRTERRAAANAHVAAMEAADLGAISPRLRLVVTGCAALVATNVRVSTARFSEALAIQEADRWPFELARIQLLYGERLRRAGRIRESRAQLNGALERFQWLGAGPWTSRALDELRATGQTRVRDVQNATKRLTARELRVAALAASGLRNKEIAAQLFVSERTVAAHLHRSFPKLGVTSRAGLRDALAARLQSASEETTGKSSGSKDLLPPLPDGQPLHDWQM